MYVICAIMQSYTRDGSFTGEVYSTNEFTSKWMYVTRNSITEGVRDKWLLFR